jgi:hypothetical protein
MKSFFGLNFSDGVPTTLAIEIVTNGYTEEEERRIMVEGGNGDEADEWIARLRQNIFFGQACTDILRDHGLLEDEDDNHTVESEEDIDPRTLLWESIKIELEKSESCFKHRVCVLDNVVKGFMRVGRRLDDLRNR